MVGWGMYIKKGSRRLRIEGAVGTRAILVNWSVCVDLYQSDILSVLCNTCPVYLDCHLSSPFDPKVLLLLSQ